MGWLGRAPNQGASVGSQGVQTGGKQTRAAAAAAQSALLDLAATNLGVAKSSLTVGKGVVSGGGKSVTYGELIGDKLFNVKIRASRGQAAISVASGSPGTKPVGRLQDRRHAGRRASTSRTRSPAS